MARDRRLINIPVGEYTATVTWIEFVYRQAIIHEAESVGVKVEKSWVYVYLHDGAEVLKWSRTRNKTAQVYVDMTLSEVKKEKELNRRVNSTPW